MTGIAQRVEADWDHLTARLRNQAPETSASSAPVTQENPVTETAQAPAVATVSFWSALHQNVSTFASRVESFIPKLEQVATTPMLDELIEAGLAATGQGGAEAIVAGVISVLKAHGNGGESTVDTVIDLLKAVTHMTPAVPAAAAVQAPKVVT